MRKMKFLTVFFVASVSCISLFAETNWSDYSRWSIGIEAGGNVFDGDIQVSGSETRILHYPSVGAYVEYGISPILSGGLAYNYHRLSADEQVFSFKSNVHQIYPFLSINFVNLFVRQNQCKWGVWGSAGMGMGYYNSYKQKNTGTLENPVYTDYASTEDKIALTIPVSLLLEYNITKRLAVNARYQYSGFNQDNLEGGGKETQDRYSGVTNDYIADLTVGLRWKFTQDKHHVRNVDMATYLPIYDKPAPLKEQSPDTVQVLPDNSDLQDQIDSLSNRIKDLENRPEPPVDEDVIYSNPPIPMKEVVVVFERTMYGINFETAKDIIKSESYPILDNVVVLLEEFPYYDLMIKGHTDDVGGMEYNMDLSRRRANSVKRYMVEHGIAENRITTEGYGYTQPVSNNNSAYGRSRNRRVDFVVSYEKRQMESQQSLPPVEE